MTLTIKLKNPKYCDGCPCMNYDMEMGNHCNIYNYYDQAPEPSDIKRKGDRIIRPSYCIKENGL